MRTQELQESSTTRWEHDSLGTRAVAAEAYYGIQTLRAVENFPISGVQLSQFPPLIRALAYIKKACALTNHELGLLDTDRTDAIAKACDELLAGKYKNEFVVDMIQGGAGTSTNMNANEVIANRGLEIMAHHKGEYDFLHPNDHVNMSQSTNDVYPTAIKLAVLFMVDDTLAALQKLENSLNRKGKEFANVIKMGRTENQDAVPMTLGQEFEAYGVMISQSQDRLSYATKLIQEINLGATAIGTGINSPPGYAERVTEVLAELTGIALVKAPNLVEATQDASEYVQVSATMKRTAVQVSKICNDLRWLSSGPRCGLGEIQLPAVQPGSSIMPGKVNPVIPEVVRQVCFQVMAGDLAVTMAAEAGELELNAFEPIIAFNLLQGLQFLTNGCTVLRERCIDGIQANVDQCRRYVENSIGLVTALNPVLGYERSVSLAKQALNEGESVYQLVLKNGWLSQDQLDDMLNPENMIHPRQIPPSRQ
ncbi:aspartate ammonia-lyase [Alicyclobacillaceae bacterium I2511]|nr:aspartate ammonia-lyase [Alicyclobacillaceae bacterium I2511]